MMSLILFILVIGLVAAGIGLLYMRSKIEKDKQEGGQVEKQKLVIPNAESKQEAVAKKETKKSTLDN